MQAAIEALRRELRALERISAKAKDELDSARPGSEHQTQAVRAYGALVGEMREITEAIDLLTRAETIRAQRAS